MRRQPRRRTVWLALAVIPLALMTCSTKRVGVLVEPPDLARAPDCFWIELANGELGPCVEAFIADAFQKDCEADAMVKRRTSQIEKCEWYEGND